MAQAFIPPTSAELLSPEERKASAAPSQEDLQLADEYDRTHPPVEDTPPSSPLNPAMTPPSQPPVQQQQMQQYPPTLSQQTPAGQQAQLNQYSQAQSNQYPQAQGQSKGVTPAQTNQPPFTPSLAAKIDKGEDISYEEFSAQSDPEVQRKIIREIQKRLPVLSGHVNLTDLKPKAIWNLGHLQQLAEANGDVLLITSGNDSKHGTNSAHYYGEAIDIRIFKDLNNPKNKGVKNDEYSRAEEFRRAKAYAQMAGFTSIRDELTVGNSPHSHVSLSEGYVDAHNHVLQGQWVGKKSDSDSYLVPESPLVLDNRTLAQRAKDSLDKSGKTLAQRTRDQMKLKYSTGPSQTLKTMFSSSKAGAYVGVKNGREQYDLPNLVYEEANVAGIPSDVLGALIQQESGGDYRAVSPQGARGLTQIMPATLEEMLVGSGLTPQDVENNPKLQVRYGAKYLKQKMGEWGGNLAQSLGAYNAGTGNIQAAQKTGKIPEETINYVSNIMAKVDPSYGGKPNRERAIGQILGKIASPNLAEYKQQIKDKQKASLEKQGFDAITATKNAFMLPLNPAGYFARAGEVLFGSDPSQAGVPDYEASARRHSKLLEAIDELSSNVFKSSPKGQLRQTLEAYAKDKYSPGAFLASNLATSAAVLEEFSRSTAQSLNNVLFPVFKRAGINMEPSSGWKQVVTDGLLGIAVPIMGIKAASANLPHSEDGLTDTQREIALNNPSLTAKHISQTLPELASTLVSIPIWSEILGMGASSAVASKLSKVVAPATNLLQKVLPAPLIGYGQSLTQAILEHSPVISADMASRAANHYLLQSMNPNSPDYNLNPSDQLLNYFVHGFEGAVTGMAMSAGPAVARSIYGTAIASFMGPLTRTVPAFARFVEDPRVAPWAKGVAVVQRSGSLGITAGASTALIADMFDLDKVVFGKDISWGEMMGMGGLLGAGVASGAAAYALKNPKMLYTARALTEESLNPLRAYTEKFASQELIDKMREQSISAVRPQIKEKILNNIKVQAEEASLEIHNRSTLIDTSKKALEDVDLKISTLKEIKRYSEEELLKFDSGASSPNNQSPAISGEIEDTPENQKKYPPGKRVERVNPPKLGAKAPPWPPVKPEEGEGSSLVGPLQPHPQAEGRDANAIPPQESATKLAELQQEIVIRDNRRALIEEERRKPGKAADKNLKSLYDQENQALKEAKKEAVEFEKNNPEARKFLSLLRSNERVSKQIADLTKTRELMSDQIGKQEHILEAVKEQVASWSERSTRLVENDPDLIDKVASGDTDALVKALSIEGFAQGPRFSPEVEHIQRVLDNVANSQVAKLKDPATSVFGRTVMSALTDQGIELKEVENVYFPDQGIKKSVKETKGGFYTGAKATEIYQQSPITWKNVKPHTGGGRRMVVASPIGIQKYIEAKFPNKNFKNLSIASPEEPNTALDFRKLTSKIPEVDRESHAEEAYRAAALAQDLGEIGVPVLGLAGNSLEVGDLGRVELKPQYEEVRKFLEDRPFDISGGEEFGVTNSHDLFNLSATAAAIENNAVNHLVNGSKYSIQDGKMVFPNGLKQSSMDFTSDALLALATNFDELHVTPDGISKIFTDKMNFEMSQMSKSGVNMGAYTPAVTEVGIQAITEGDVVGAKALTELISSEILSESDRLSYKITNLQETMGLRDKNLEVVLGRVLNSHIPIRDQILSTLKTPNGVSPANQTKYSEFLREYGPEEKIVAEFDIDTLDMVFGNTSVGNWLEKYGKGPNEEVAKKYVRSLNEASQLANTVARRSKNSENLFSTHLADMLYKNYLPAEFKNRWQYAKSSRAGTFFDESKWDYKNPKLFFDSVGKANAKLSALLGDYAAKGTNDFNFADVYNPKKFAQASLEERMEFIHKLSQSELEFIRENSPKRFEEMVNETEKLTFAPFFKDVSIDPMVFVAKKLKGAVNANNLGDFIHAGTLLEKKTEAGNSVKLAIVSDNSQHIPGYVSLSEGVSEAYTHSKIQLSPEKSVEGKQIWVLPEFKKVLDDAFGFDGGGWSKSDRSQVPAWKDLLTGIRSLALISGAPSFSAQLMGKGLSLIGSRGYKAMSKLAGKEVGVKELLGTSESVLEGTDSERLAILEHAHNSGLNLSQMRHLSSAFTDYQMKNLTEAQKLELAKNKTANMGRWAKMVNLFVEQGKVENPLANAQSELIRQEYHPFVKGLADVYRAVTVYDNIEMTHSVNHASDQASLAAFMSLEQQLSMSLGPQLAHLRPEEARAVVSKTAAAIVNKNMGTLPTFLGSSPVQKFFREIYTTPGIQYSRLQTTVEFLDSLYGAMGGGNHKLKKSLEPFVGDAYGHYPEQIKDVVKEHTHSSLGRLMGQAAFVSLVGNWLFNSSSAWNNPPGRHFSIKTGDNEYYNLPGFLGGIKSIIRFWDDLYGHWEEGEYLGVAAVQSLAENEAMKQNWLAQFILGGTQSGRKFTQDEVFYAVTDFLLTNATGLGEIYGSKRGGHPIDAINPFKIGTIEGKSSRNTPEAQIIKDAFGSTQQNDPSLNYVKSAKVPESNQRKEMMKRAESAARYMATLDPESPEWMDSYNSVMAEMVYDMGNHPEEAVRVNYQNQPLKKRVINYTKQFKSLIDKFSNEERYRQNLKGPGADRARQYR